MRRTSAVPIQARPAMPAKTVFRPMECPDIQGLYIDNSFELNLLRELEKREPLSFTLKGTPLGARLGPPMELPRGFNDSAADSRHTGRSEDRPGGRLMIQKVIIARKPPGIVPVDTLIAICESTRFRILGATTEEAAITIDGVTAPRPQIFPIDRFATWLKSRTVISQVNDMVYPVVSFVVLGETSQLASH